jgi:hypothetical protein
VVYKKKIRRGKKNKFAFDFLSLFFSFLKKSYFGLFAQVGFLLPLLLLIKEEREKKKVFKDCGNDPSAGSPTERISTKKREFEKKRSFYISFFFLFVSLSPPRLSTPRISSG